MVTLVMQRRGGVVEEEEQRIEDAVDYYLCHPKQPVFIDTETTGFDPYTCRLVSIQLYQEGSLPLVIDARFMLKKSLNRLLSPLINSQLLFVGANIKFDYDFLLHHLGLRMVNVFDVMIAEQVCEGVGWSGAKAINLSLSLEGICKKRHIPISKEERSWFANLDDRDEWFDAFPAEIVDYMKQDVLVLEQVFYDQVEEITRKRLGRTLQIELDALPAFGEMEVNGIKVNVPGWREFIKEQAAVAVVLGEELVELLGPPIKAWQIEEYDKKKQEYDAWVADRDEAIIHFKEEWEDTREGYGNIGWGAFKNSMMSDWRLTHPNPGNPRMDNKPPNINSHDQLLIAFEALGIPAKSTGEEVLKELKDEYPIVAKLLAYRKKNKFVESFGETLLEKISDTTGRIHPSITQIGADTGRSSVSNPNTQQWPSRGPDGKRLRSLVIPGEGNVFVVNDYPNIELRIFAYMSNCQRMLQAFANGEDLHSITPRAMFGLSDDIDVKRTVACDRQGRVLNGWTYREIGKTVNFGIIYGMGVHKLARTLNTTVREAERLMQGYYDMYPEVKTYQEAVKKRALRDGVTYTLSGRPHYYHVPREPEMDRVKPFQEARQEFWEAKKEYRKTISSIERMACNYPIQGTSADITKIALGKLVRRVDLHKVKLVLVVHDEIVLECPEEMGPEVAALLEEVMTESCAELMKGFEVTCVGASVAKTWTKE